MRPVMLVIMDGVGINPRPDHNAVVMAKKPFIEKMWKDYPVTSIKTSGEDVGLPSNVMGNSEVGHMNIGAGRVVYQPFTLINKEIREGSFFSNGRALEILEKVKGKTLHLMGLVSTGGVHGDVGHIEAILKLCKEKGQKDVAIHAFMDGRDMPPTSGLELILRIERAIKETGVGRIATVSGRYYAMDRDKRWERTKKAYDVVVDGLGPTATSAAEAVQANYDRKITDEFIDPVVIGSASAIQKGDAVFFWNFRPDRARQMTRALMDPDFKGFERARFPKIHYLGMVQYDEAFTLPIAYPPQNLANVLAEVLAAAGKTQFHSAETEKYPHVTFFLNGGVEEPKAGEDRVMIPSPKVATYDLQPEMSAPALTDAVMTALASKKYDFLIVNYANGDMVGHTGDLEAAIKSVEAVDAGLSRILPELLAQGGAAIVTADHGNCEQMIWYETGEPHTQHTTFEVTLTVLGAGGVKLRSGGRLADIAPTILALMNLPKPAEMTGESLIL
jgi:2,3-bisphosphoglycerate-independent phosphoglycerate mutase